MNKMKYFRAICKITGFCELANVPYELHELHDGFKVTFSWFGGDIICHSYSYGGTEGFFETMGFEKDGDDVRGNLSAVEVCENIMEEYSQYTVWKWFHEGE